MLHEVEDARGDTFEAKMASSHRIKLGEFWLIL